MQRERNDEISLLCWGNIHTALFVAGTLTFGFLDAFTAVLMMEEYGVGAEFNPLMRMLFLTQGITGFIAFKVLAAALILSVPFLLYKEGTMQWAKACFLLFFAVGGALAAMNNHHFLLTGRIWIEPGIAVGLFLIMMVVALQIGEIMDSQREKMFRISDDRWAQMKLEMGYPEG